jgi:methyltransferase (TIGR00027 family)
MMRAQESLRPDRLFDDPYAAAFVAAVPRPFADVPDSGDGELAALEAAFNAAIVIRTRFFDEYLTSACAAGCRQVVLLAAGLDTRAFRLNWPTGVRVFELDLPDVLAFKETVLTQHAAEPRCTRTTVAVDLREDWPAALTAAGFDHNAMTAWTAEGLLTYLSNDDAVRLLDSVGSLSVKDSQLSLEHANVSDDSILAQASAMSSMSEVTSMWQGGMHDDVAEWLRQHDWRVEIHDRSTLAESYGRPMSETSIGGFLAATRVR